jgi:hypothetical protein
MKRPTCYKLRQQDIDSDPDGFILNLPAGFQFENDLGCHTRGFDTMKELRDEARTAVIRCDCSSCTNA